MVSAYLSKVNLSTSFKTVAPLIKGIPPPSFISNKILSGESGTANWYSSTVKRNEGGSSGPFLFFFFFYV